MRFRSCIALECGDWDWQADRHDGGIDERVDKLGSGRCRSSASARLSAAPQPVPGAPKNWWETRLMVILAIAASMVPLFYPPIPPLVDLLGHMGRYRVEIGGSPWLDRYYSIDWALIGNLGGDLVIMALAPVFGLELAVKLLVLVIPALTVAGFLWVAREVHGRIPPAAYFALPFAYGHPFLFGFVNFALAMALAFLAFGLWLRLSRTGRIRLRQWLFIPISLIIFFTHAYGWGVLGLLCFSAEAVRLHDRGERWFRAGLHAAISAAVMALPVLFMLVWREGAAGNTTDWFNWKSKWLWVQMALRDRWKIWDLASVSVAASVLAIAVVSPPLTFSRNLAFSALVLAAFFLLLPRIVFGSAYADMRLVPYVFAVALLAIRARRPISPLLGNAIAVAAVLFCVARLAGNTISLAQAAGDQRQKLETLREVPQGARVLTLVNLNCGRVWPLGRNGHLGAMVVVRKHGFSNDQWIMDGLNLLKLKYTRPGFFAADPSEIVRPSRCPDRLHLTIDESLKYFPRGDFDYVWLIDVPAYDAALAADLALVDESPGSILYRVRGPR